MDEADDKNESDQMEIATVEIGKSTNSEWMVWKQCEEKSCSVEIHIKNEGGKSQLTTVHFNHDFHVNFRNLILQPDIIITVLHCVSIHQYKLREEVVEKVKWNIKRGSMEEKQRELLDLFEPLKKDFKHQVACKTTQP